MYTFVNKNVKTIKYPKKNTNTDIAFIHDHIKLQRRTRLKIKPFTQNFEAHLTLLQSH